MMVIIVDHAGGLPGFLLDKYFPVGAIGELKNGKIRVSRLELDQKYFITRQLTEEETMAYKMVYPDLNWEE